MNDKIIIRGARTHNLKNINIDLPKNKLIVITGVSGSGKSSLAFDTLYAEGQRRYVESLSTYARQFLQQSDKPEVDLIEGLSPAISIEQKISSHNPRSTVGTTTEIYDYLRLLYARIGDPFCPKHNLKLESQSVSQIVENILNMENNIKIAILSPVVNGRKGEYLELLQSIQTKGFTKVRIDGTIYDIDSTPKLEKNKKHSIDIVIDRLKISADKKNRITDSVETSLKYNNKISILKLDINEVTLFSTSFSCSDCDYSIPELEPRIFSFNNPIGACNKCQGLGQINYFDPEKLISYGNLSLSQGAIKGWDINSKTNYLELYSLAKFFNFNLDTPWKDLDSDIKNIILHGYDDSLINIYNYNNQISHKKFIFKGIIAYFQQKFLETDSNNIREELLKYQKSKVCDECLGQRLKLEYRSIKINDLNLPELTSMQLKFIKDYLQNLNLTGSKKYIGERIIKEIDTRLHFLINVGLDYLTLSRSSSTLSGGESQRIRLASQIGSGLTGVMYVLDEPSIGLHQRDNDRLIQTLNNLKNLGNTVILVEHDEDTIRAADYILDIGPGAGEHGGNIIANGSLKDILHNENSITGKYLSKKLTIEFSNNRRTHDHGYFELIGACRNNLKNVNLKIPFGTFVCITGVSGSGKSTLINDTLYNAISKILNGYYNIPENYEKLINIEKFDKVINVDQSPIGRTSKSNPATYTGLFTPIREIFAQMSLSKERGYQIGRFSFNSSEGRCNYCSGDGIIKVEMHFLPDMHVVCDKCNGKRYNNETLEVLYKGKNINDILKMTVNEGIEMFKNIPSVFKKLQTLEEVGLGYIRIGQPSTTLSGGEAQRVKLSLELSKRDTGKTLYILDEPTTGLHFQDISLLLKILHKFVNNGNTVVVIEHNLDVIKTADWVIDLGPEGGINGGHIIATGTPEQIIKNKQSYTGKYLAKYLKK